MSYIQANQIGVTEFGGLANVPNNDVARLMYYLDCVCGTINYRDNDIQRYRNYRNWASLSNDEVRVLLILCWTLSPDEFDGRVFFHSDALCENRGNKFYEIRQIRNLLTAVGSIVIAGRSCQVNKIMTYKLEWMQENYFKPMQRLAQRFRNQQAASNAAAARFGGPVKTPICAIM